MTDLMNSQLHSGTRLRSYVPLAGNQPSATEKIAIAISASQKYGTAEKKVETGRSESAQVPRRQPMPEPMSVPITKLRIVAMPTRPMVHGSAVEMTSVTDEPVKLVDM